MYEEKCGQSYDKINGVKTLIFPQNGILVLNEAFDRHVNYKYYLIDDLGKRTEIQAIRDFKSRINNQPYILMSGSGTIGQTIEANSSRQEEKEITYSDFYVYNKEIADRNNAESQQKFDSITTKIVNQCRQE